MSTSFSIHAIRRKPLALCAASLFACSLPAVAAVSNCGDDPNDFGTLRHAVLTASTGDTIDLSGLACSKITLQNGALHVGIADLTIKGAGMNAFTLDGNGADRVFVHTGAGALTLSDLTVAHGTLAAAKAYGGCIYSKGAVTLTRATLTSCKALGQSAAAGGGVLAIGKLTVDSSVISDNVADATVGQVSTAALGGGLLSLDYNDDLELKNSVVSGNTVHAGSGLAQGGGVVGNSLLVKYSTVTANKAISQGNQNNYSAAGGMAAFYSVFVAGSTIDNNQADVAGGVFIGDGQGTANFLQSTISSNKGNLAVGGIDSGAAVALVNTTVAFNTGGLFGGGGLGVESARTITLESSILADNSPSDVDGGMSISGGENIIKIAGPNVSSLPVGTIALDPQLQPLANNGGPTRTHAISAASPAIDAGNTVILPLMNDQRGLPYARTVGAGTDIGAYEFDSDHIFGNGF